MSGLRVWLFLSLIPIEAKIKIQRNFRKSHFISLHLTQLLLGTKSLSLHYLKNPVFRRYEQHERISHSGLPIIDGEDAVNSQTNGVMFCEVRGMTKFIFLT